MDYLLFGKASIIGLSIAAPVGPIGLLCMQRTLASGVKTGFACGLGAATADAICGAIGAFGLTAITQLFTSISKPLALFGGVFLVWMGIQLIRTRSEVKAAVPASSVSSMKAFGTTMLLTLASPMTILSFVAVFSALSGSMELSPRSATTMVMGVFVGSAFWWLILAVLVSFVRHKIDSIAMHRIAQAAGALLLAFGGWQIQSTLF